MSPPVSEVAIIPLIKGADSRIQDNEAAKTLDRSVQLTVIRRGFQCMVWGLCENDPGLMVMIVDWDDLQSHLDFMDDPEYKPFLDDFMQIVAETIILFHTTLEQGNGILPLAHRTDYTSDVFFAFFLQSAATQVLESELGLAFKDVSEGLMSTSYAPNSFASGLCSDEALYEERDGKGPEKPWVSLMAWPSPACRGAAWEQGTVLGSIPEIVKSAGGELEIYEVYFQPLINPAR